MMRKCQVRFGGGRRMEKVHERDVRGGNLASRLPYLIWGFQHVAGFRRRHVGASIQDAWTSSLDHVRAALDADPSFERTTILRASTQEIGVSREAVLDAVAQRLELSQKQAAAAYRLAEEYEP